MSARLFWQVCSTEGRKRMSYRADFWLTALVGFTAQVGISYFLIQAVFQGGGQSRVGGFDPAGMLFYYVAVALLGKLVRSTEMDQVVSQDIYEGGLTRYLLYPAPYAAVKYAQQVGALLPLAVQLVLFGTLAPLVLGLPEGVGITAGTVARCAAATAVANALQFLLTFPIQAVSFWTDNVWSLMIANRILSSLLGGMMLPLTLFPEAAQRVLALLPFRYLFAFPVESLLGRLSPVEWAEGMAVALGWCVVLGLFGRALWRRGELQYTGVGM
ncbi:MAG: ABC-2 family transporter protein [Planctomycetes bacterium]|nr:ABC-2 family transporter protein [Planctomycetota bacterium]